LKDGVQRQIEKLHLFSWCLFGICLIYHTNVDGAMEFVIFKLGKLVSTFCINHKKLGCLANFVAIIEVQEV